ncbi:hypothetical protein V6N11_039146 [Hibiscus sabdariffa]|uniref:Uncharacterized protein n=1 Tax=Hibiscus sabdariffa TaxID=183260 RepID=A0ABR2SM33_9ROSI
MVPTDNDVVVNSTPSDNAQGLSSYPNAVYYTVPPQHPVFNVSHAFPQSIPQVHPSTSVRVSNTMTPQAPQNMQAMPSLMGHPMLSPQYVVPPMAAVSSSVSPQALIATPEVVGDNAWFNTRLYHQFLLVVPPPRHP